MTLWWTVFRTMTLRWTVIRTMTLWWTVFRTMTLWWTVIRMARETSRKPVQVFPDQLPVSFVLVGITAASVCLETWRP